MRFLAYSATALAAAALVGSAGAAGRGGGARTIGAALGAKGEVPAAKGAAGASGSFSATGGFTCATGEQNCVTKPGKVQWTLTFKGLTGPALLAHIHLGKAGTSGPVAISLCAPCHSGSHGTIFITRKLFQLIAAKAAYVNVHTKQNPLGEIRGQVRPISATL